jgi:hypothetical protein
MCEWPYLFGVTNSKLLMLDIVVIVSKTIFFLGNKVVDCFQILFLLYTKAALSNQNVPVATFATFVSLLSPKFREVCCKNFGDIGTFVKKMNFLLVCELQQLTIS